MSAIPSASCARLVCAVAGLLFFASALADVGSRVRKFDIAAQPAASALNEFARQADITLVFSIQTVAGAHTREVKGALSVADALAQLLSGTTLSYHEIGKNTVAIRPRTKATGSTTTPQASRLADAVKVHLAQVGADGLEQTEPARISAPRAVASDDEVEVEVTGSRIRSVLGEATVQPVYVYSREDLERLGIQQMTDLNNYIPQLPTLAWESTPETGFVNMHITAGRTDFNGGLRGLGNTATLLLINGRRAPKLGTATSNDSYDLTGIPMSAVERVEVLTDGASAIYGADAAAGVVNVILKKDYTGSQLNVVYGNTFVSDTGHTNIQLSTAYSTEKFSVNLQGTWSKTNAFSPADRWFTASNDRRPFGGNDGRSIVPAGTGSVVNVANEPLPGLTTREAAIPAGSDGVNLTIEDFANAGPIAERFDPPKYTVYSDRRLKNVRGGVEYEFSRWVTAFAELGYSEQSSWRPGVPRDISVRVPAGYVGNPFGVDVFVRRVFWEMGPYMDTEFLTKNRSVLAGLRGPLGARWRYEFAAQYQGTDYRPTGLGANTTFGGTTAVNAAVNNPDPALRPILLNDGLTTSPNSDAVLRAMLVDRSFSEHPDYHTLDFKVDGPLWTLPAGEVAVAFGTEYREEFSSFVAPPNNDLGRLDMDLSRYAFSVFGELRVPVVAPHQNLPLVNRLTVNISARRDDYNDFDPKIVPRFGLLYYPVQSVALRASYNKGYKVPNLSAMYRPRTEGTVSIGSAAQIYDPMRGGEHPFVNVEPPGTGYVLTQINGGNPDLRPELSRNINLGVLVDIPFVPGLSMGVDYYDIYQTDRLGGGLADIIANFEERIIRDPPTPEDIARGYAGLMRVVDVSPVNIASYKTTGFDFQLRYFRDMGEFGSVDMRFTATKPKTGETRGAPNRPVVPNIPNSSYWRGTGMISWRRSALSVGTNMNFTSSYLGRYFPGGSYFNNNIMNASVLMVDANVFYDFRKRGTQLGGWLGTLFNDSRVGVNLFNIFNREPELLAPGMTASYTVDPRGRRYQISVVKDF